MRSDALLPLLQTHQDAIGPPVISSAVAKKKTPDRLLRGGTTEVRRPRGYRLLPLDYLGRTVVMEVFMP